MPADKRLRAIWIALCVCCSKVSTENYDKIVKGMKEEKVTGILGIASE